MVVLWRTHTRALRDVDSRLLFDIFCKIVATRKLALYLVSSFPVPEVLDFRLVLFPILCDCNFLEIQDYVVSSFYIS